MLWRFLDSTVDSCCRHRLFIAYCRVCCYKNVQKGKRPEEHRPIFISENGHCALRSLSYLGSFHAYVQVVEDGTDAAMSEFVSCPASSRAVGDERNILVDSPMIRASRFHGWRQVANCDTILICTSLFYFCQPPELMSFFLRPLLQGEK